MTLSSASALIYAPFRGWSVIPSVGGTPHHTRNSSGTYLDQNGVLQIAIVNTPRFNWATPAGSTERRPALSLEQARTFSWTYSDDLTQASAWTLDACTIATGNIAPSGALTACKVKEDTANTGHGVRRSTPTLTDNTKSSISFAAAAVERSWLRFAFVDKSNTGRNAWVNLATGATGTVDAAIKIAVTPEAYGYWRISVSVSASAGGNAPYLVIQTATGDGDTGHVGTTGSGILLTNIDFEIDQPTPSSHMGTGAGTVARSADQFYWDYTPVPQAAMHYSRHIERGTLAASGRLWEIGKSDASSPHAFVYSDGTYYRFRHQTAAGQSESVLAAAPAVGDTVELLALLASDGSTRLIQSINGLAVSAAGDATAKTLQAAWADTKLWLNSVGTNSPGLADFADLKCVKYADVIGVTDADRMTELRAYELGANGELVNPGS